jgi:hypothetical protein
VLAWDEEIAGRKLAFVAGKELIKLEGLSSLRRTPPLALKTGRTLSDPRPRQEPGA